jgi:hypothetical protein
MSRFPMMAFLFKTFMPQTIKKFSEDTKTHESHTMALIEKYVHMTSSSQYEADNHVHRRLAKPEPRPDFLTRVLEQKEDITPVQLAAHASDFV